MLERAAAIVSGALPSLALHPGGLVNSADFVKCPACGLNHRVKPEKVCPKCGASDDAPFMPSVSAAAPEPRSTFRLVGFVGVPLGGWLAFKAAVWILSGGVSVAHSGCVSECRATYRACVRGADPSCSIVGEQLQCMI